LIFYQPELLRALVGGDGRCGNLLRAVRRSADAIVEDAREIDLDQDWFWQIADRYRVGLAPWPAFGQSFEPALARTID
jgi:hypothetical protein